MSPPIEDPDLAAQAIIAIGAGALALVAAMYFVSESLDAKYMKEHRCDEAQTKEVKRLQKFINEGATSFLHTEYFYLSLFVLVVFGAISVILIQDSDEERGLLTAVCLVVGASLSAAAGYIGMIIATKANATTCFACTNDISSGLRTSFASGAVMSNSVVGLGLLGLTIMFIILDHRDNTWNYLSGFGFGASCIALFARVGGGVFTKAADVGADLVGKVEQGIPEDDPRNPAVIADNVGDNVGDVAGMGADLFESFVGSIIATSTLGDGILGPLKPNYVALPFWIASMGIVASLIGTAVVVYSKLDENAPLSKLLSTLSRGIYTAMVLVMLLCLIPCLTLFEPDEGMRLWGCVLIGLVAGEVVGKFTEYCTSYEDQPTREISAAAKFGEAPVIIKGFGVGMISVVVPTLALSVVIVACNEIAPDQANLYGISLAAVGLLSTLGITLATDAYGPVADNAGGIAEMAGLGDEVRDRTDSLDSLGNTTAATGKGFAIGSAVLTSVGLIQAYLQETGLSPERISLRDPNVVVGSLIGAMLPFLFAALTMLSVDKSARAMISEVRLQFAQCPQLMMKPGQSEEDYDKEFDALQVKDENDHHFGKLQVPCGGETRYFPDSERCVQIATTSAIQEMVLPGTLAVFSPAVLGYLLGAPSLAGLLVGALSSGFMLALTMANAGGAWDNAKKWVEKCASEGEPVKNEEGETVLDYSGFGVKKAAIAKEVARNGNLKQLLKEHQSAEDYDGDDSKIEELAKELVELYKERHDPVVVGDTVGDPFKDTSGPSLNILIKLMSVVSLVLAPTFERKSFHEDRWWIAVIVFVVVGFALIVLTNIFKKSQDKREKLAQEEMSKAHKNMQNSGAQATSEEAGGAEAGDIQIDEEEGKEAGNEA
eukprot:gb/GECG01004532.1/.p1 GENE.gb/GECG01004532.1/~~gb/GECG01004532.1/.p1  ORF type:complete len:886 (+),score=123.25 gb/GECG01004532.1/:1-2658(+)